MDSQKNVLNVKRACHRNIFKKMQLEISLIVFRLVKSYLEISAIHLEISLTHLKISLIELRLVEL